MLFKRIGDDVPFMDKHHTFTSINRRNVCQRNRGVDVDKFANIPLLLDLRYDKSPSSPKCFYMIFKLLTTLEIRQTIAFVHSVTLFWNSITVLRFPTSSMSQVVIIFSLIRKYSLYLFDIGPRPVTYGQSLQNYSKNSEVVRQSHNDSSDRLSSIY